MKGVVTMAFMLLSCVRFVAPAVDAAPDDIEVNEDAVFEGPARAYLYVEAESGILVPPFVVKQDEGASGGAYLFDDWPTDGHTTDGQARYSVSITRAGTYRLWGRCRALSNATDSFFVQVDGRRSGFHTTGEDPHGPGWRWVVWALGVAEGEIKPLDLELTSGELQVIVSSRESQAALDRLLLSDDLAFIPGD